MGGKTLFDRRHPPWKIVTGMSGTLLKFFSFLTCLILSLADCRAQESTLNSIHWAYSSYFGTGWYRVSGDRDVFVVRMTPRWEYREAAFPENGEREIGIEFRFPITAGLDNFSTDDIPGAIDLDNVASLSVTPGVDITIPVTERWWLRPYAAVGWGTTLNDSDSAWTYWAGVKSRYSFQNGNLDWALVNSIAYVGNSPNIGPSDDFWPLMAGLEFDYPFGDRRPDHEQLYLSWHGMYTTFEDDLDQVIDDGSIDPITDQWEFGFSIHKKDTRIKIWWFSFDRLGLAYRTSSSGDLKGISFVFRSIFER
jgi:hypothetical protein